MLYNPLYNPLIKETCMDKIAQAAATARTLFLQNEWTWRGEPTPPSELDIAATFSSLRWEIERKFGDERGTTRYAATGRLLVIRSGNGSYTYTVQVGREEGALA